MFLTIIFLMIMTFLPVPIDYIKLTLRSNPELIVYNVGSNNLHDDDELEYTTSEIFKLVLERRTGLNKIVSSLLVQDNTRKVVSI